MSEVRKLSRRCACIAVSCIAMFMLGVVMALPALAAGAAEDGVSRQAVNIWSEGTPLAGDLWLPAGLDADEQVPGMLLVHGWGGVKSHLNDAYAPTFARLGIAVLTFDFRSWGESPGPIVRTGEPIAEGQPLESLGDGYQEARNLVNPLMFLEDIRNALAYLMGEPAAIGWPSGAPVSVAAWRCRRPSTFPRSTCS